MEEEEKPRAMLPMCSTKSQNGRSSGFCGIRVEFINEILGCLGEEEGYAPCSSLPWFPTAAAGNIPTPDAEIHASGSIFLNVGCLSDLAVDLLLAAACALFPPSSSPGSAQPRRYYRPQ